ncbi:unnamed protein product [Gulo gulo]|uniref:Uncharacterized protein n=1 Tax=Gulo gulo TaxID=48420 RepID=A0A9X9MCN5_GULGU|nr:unnamed protein product [Gulo gulo]
MYRVKKEIDGEEKGVEGHPVHGQCWTPQELFPVFHLHCQDQVVGWQACSLWQDHRGHEHCGGHGVLQVQERQD